MSYPTDYIVTIVVYFSILLSWGKKVLQERAWELGGQRLHVTSLPLYPEHHASYVFNKPLLDE